MAEYAKVFDGGNVRLVPSDKPSTGAGIQDHPSGQGKADSTDWDAFHKDVTELFQMAQLVLERKHRDYGPLNVSAAPGGALNGLRVRIHDKTARINNLIDSGTAAQFESLEDSFLDLMNYSAIALLVLRGKWQ